MLLGSCISNQSKEVQVYKKRRRVRIETHYWFRPTYFAQSHSQQLMKVRSRFRPAPNACLLCCCLPGHPRACDHIRECYSSPPPFEIWLVSTHLRSQANFYLLTQTQPKPSLAQFNSKESQFRIYSNVYPNSNLR